MDLGLFPGIPHSQLLHPSGNLLLPRFPNPSGTGAFPPSPVFPSPFPLTEKNISGISAAPGTSLHGIATPAAGSGFGESAQSIEASRKPGSRLFHGARGAGISSGCAGRGGGPIPVLTPFPAAGKIFPRGIKQPSVSGGQQKPGRAGKKRAGNVPQALPRKGFAGKQPGFGIRAFIRRNCSSSGIGNAVPCPEPRDSGTQGTADPEGPEELPHPRIRSSARVPSGFKRGIRRDGRSSRQGISHRESRDVPDPPPSARGREASSRTRRVRALFSPEKIPLSAGIGDISRGNGSLLELGAIRTHQNSREFGRIPGIAPALGAHPTAPGGTCCPRSCRRPGFGNAAARPLSSGARGRDPSS